MRKVKLRMNEQEKYETIKEYVDHGGNKNKIALKLSISRRQVDRLIIKYKKNGKSAFIHGNRGKVPAKALDKSMKILYYYIDSKYDEIILKIKGQNKEPKSVNYFKDKKMFYRRF